MKKLIFSLLGFTGIAYGAIGTGPGGTFIQNTNTLQPNTTFYVSSGTVTNLQTTTLKFRDGTTQTTAAVSGGGTSSLEVKVNSVQISSPTKTISFDSNFLGNQSPTGTSNISLNPGSTLYIQNAGTLQASSQFYVSSGSVNGPFSAFRNSLQALLTPSTTEAFSLVNVSSHQVYVLFKSSGTSWWRVGNDVTNLGTPEFDIYNATTGIKDISISTNDVITSNANIIITPLNASQPVKTDINKGLISGLINVTSDITGTVPTTNLPANVDYTNVQQTISANKIFTSSITFKNLISGSGQCIGLDSSSNTVIVPCGTGGGGGGVSVYPATATASFPYGFSVSTVTSLPNGDFTEVVGQNALIKMSNNSITPLASVNYNGFLIGVPYNILSFYQFGSIEGSLGFSNINGNFFTILDASNNVEHAFGVNGTYQVGGLNIYNNTLSVDGTIGVLENTLTTSQTLGTTYYLVLGDASAGNLTFSLPDIGSVGFGVTTYRLYHICKYDSSANTISFSAPGSNDSLDSVTLSNQFECVDYYGDVTNPATGSGKWRLVGHSGQTTSSGGASTLAVATGTSSGFTTTASSPTAVIDFSSDTFNARLIGGATAFVTLNASSVTLNGRLVAGSNITLTPGTGITTIAASGGGGGVSVYPATATASFPFGLSASTGVFTSTITAQTVSISTFPVGSYIGFKPVGNSPVGMWALGPSPDIYLGWPQSQQVFAAFGGAQSGINESLILNYDNTGPQQSPLYLETTNHFSYSSSSYDYAGETIKVSNSDNTDSWTNYQGVVISTLPSITATYEIGNGFLESAARTPYFDISISSYGTPTDGNVGIGIKAPTQKLDVAGNIKFSGALMPNNAAGVSGQILQSAGAGSPPTWVNNTGGGGTGGTTIWAKLNGSALDNAVSTVNVTSPLTATSSPSGQINLTVDYSSVTTLGYAPTTTKIPEGSNLYFTTARATTTISASAPILYANGVVSIDKSSATLQGTLSAATPITLTAGVFGVDGSFLSTTTAASTYLSQSSATATYLQNSSATATYLQLSSATATYDKKTDTIAASRIAAGSLGTSVIASSITLASMYGAPTLTGTNFTSLPGAQVTSGVPAANIAAGSLGTSVLVSSLTQVNSAAGSYTLSNITINAQGQVTAASNGSATGSVAGSTGTIGISIDGGGSAIVAGSTRSITVPYACTVSSWTLVADTSGSISVHVSSSTYSDYPTLYNISGSGPPLLASAQKNSAAPTGWATTTIPQGTIISFVVDSAATVKWANLILWCIKS